MLTEIFKKPAPVDKEFGFMSIVYLVSRHNLPIERKELFQLGIDEGLTNDFIEKAFNEAITFSPELENKNFRKWCLEKILYVLIIRERRINEDLYKILVNLVNGLILEFQYLDKTIRKIKNELN